MHGHRFEVNILCIISRHIYLNSISRKKYIKKFNFNLKLLKLQIFGWVSLTHPCTPTNFTFILNTSEIKAKFE